MNDMTFGEKLQMLRKSRGMSQEDLAHEMEVSRQAVSRWEVGDTMPEVRYVMALSKFFGVTTDYLLQTEQSQPTGAVPPTRIPPAAPEEDPSVKKRRLFSRCGIACTAAGSLGILILALLSSFIETPYYETIHHDDGWITYRGTQGYNFLGFITYHHLEWLMALLIATAFIGIFLLWQFWRESRKTIS